MSLPVSDAFIKALKRPHKSVVRVDIIDYKGGFVGSLTSDKGKIKVTGGSVKADATAKIRRECDVEVAFPDDQIDEAKALLSPRFGHELKVWRGISAADLDAKDDEIVPLGVFPISDFEISEEPKQLVGSVHGYDRAWKIQRAAFTDTYHVIGSGEDAIAMIENILRSQAPSIPTRFIVDKTFATGVKTFTWNPGDDPWQACLDIAKAGRLHLYIDPEGFATLQNVRSYVGASTVARFVEGEKTLLSGRIKHDLEHTRNHIIITGSKTRTIHEGAIIRAVAKDLDPSSATYVHGPLGSLPYFEEVKFATTQQLAQWVADIGLELYSGWIEEVPFDGIVYPHIEPDDKIHIKRDRLGVDAPYILRQMTIPLDSGTSMSGTGKRRVIAA